MAELEHLGGKRAESARARRAEQLRRWRGSPTEQEPADRPGAGPQARRGGPRVRFEDGAVFLAACSSGDTDEVRRLLARGADVDTANVDGLTALHQACIDENLDVVKFLVENGASVNQQDNEGWTPLHAAASCGYLNIAEYFINHGACVGIVNNEGEVPSDLAEEPAMKDLLLEQVKKQGLDLEQARRQEEQQMLQDARQWLNSGRIADVRQARSGATALHVAAAKGYSEVLRLLIQAGCELNVQDHDGWTPLHAAAHWGVKEACSILAEALCDMDVRNKLGQTPFDVADEGLAEHLEALQKRQGVLRSEKETRDKLIESDLNSELHSRLFKNKEKMLCEEETPKSQRAEEESKESSSSSSEEDEGEDEASESEAEKEAGDPEAVRPQSAGGRRVSEDGGPGAVPSRPSSDCGSSVAERTPAAPQSAVPAASARRPSSLFSKPEETRDESPCSWRLGLRKTGSQNVLSEAAGAREALRDRGASVHRSASSPRISTLMDSREKERETRSSLSSLGLRRPGSTSDLEEKENRESAANLVCSGSQPRQPWRDAAKGSEAPQTVAPSTYVSTFLKRSYLTPVRDEEAESLRKARSRQARQTRRSTQGVTLTDLQEAERTFSRSRVERQAQEQPSLKPVGPGALEGGLRKHEPLAAPAQEAGESHQPWGRSPEGERPGQPEQPTAPASPSAPRPSLYTSSYLLRTGGSSAPAAQSSEPPAGTAGTRDMDRNEGGEAEPGDQSSGRMSVRERRRPRERRRGTGINFWTKDEDETEVPEEVKKAWRERLSRLESGGSDASTERASARARREAREARLATLSSRAEEDGSRDYRKLYESALTENQKLKTKLQEAQLELADVKSRLEKMAQKQDKTPERLSALETEKRERRALERKMSEMEEEVKNLHQLKQIQTLKHVNEQLQAENRALTRVVARLSEAVEGSDPQGP
ncbi:protein phosphatase 1 regulatory subunit 12B isoform X3 [Ovis aries]|uniref:Protein phosphatase 1 regulatory subunit 12B n=1 Tax=Ovis aries TaxID=9940 RepID=A0AC11DTB8_SHEEP|nr:protein phosphatase 1 regulatory subunit 12B isoform X4 [Ovis aries]XP_060252781.1 protein phosphatase 1 regulatory subunit 12B isoform X3 [Ovis aries]